MRMMAKYLSALLVAVLFSSTVVLAQDGAPQYGGTLRIGLNSEPVTLNSGLSNSQVDFLVTAKIYESLIYIDEKLDPIPGLAASWESGADGLSYTFHLQENVLWHDGTPFTSADVKFSIEEVLIPFQPQGASLFAALESVETPDEHTVILNLREPSAFLAPPFIALNAFSSPILPAHIFQGTDIANNPANSEPIGTGPFKFKEWQRGSHIILERNENYWRDGLPYLDQVVIVFLPDTSSRLLAFERGDVHYVPFGVPYSSVAQLSNDPNVEVVRFRDARYLMHGLAFNLRSEPFDDIRVRRAIALAIDKEAIVTNVAFGLDKVADSVHPSNSPYHNPDVPTYPRNLEAAAELLDEAGLTPDSNGVRLEATYRVDLGISEAAVKTAELVRDQLAQIGIRVTVVPMERASFIDTVYLNLDFEIASFFGTMGPDPGVGAKWFVSLDQPAAFTNPTGYANPELDSMFEDFNRAIDPVIRRDLFNAIQDQLLTDLPYIPIREDSWPVLVNAKYHNVGIDMFGGRADTLATAWWER